MACHPLPSLELCLHLTNSSLLIGFGILLVLNGIHKLPLQHICVSRHVKAESDHAWQRMHPLKADGTITGVANPALVSVPFSAVHGTCR